MKKLLYISTIVLGLSTTAFAQQIPQYSQYMINDYVLNPAVTGMHDYWEVKSNNRLQWVGITDAPRTFILSAHGPFRKYNMGMGGSIFADITGPTSRVGFYLSYAYHLKLSNSLKLGMGLSMGLLQYRIDGTKINLHTDGDPTLPSQVMTVYTADATFGVNLVHKNFNVGFSLPQIIGNNLKFLENQEETKSSLARHYMVMGGYTFHVRDFGIMPNLLFKYVYPTTPQFDVGLKLDWRDQFWIGATYRHDDAVAFMGGLTYKEFLIIAYSYDMTTSNLNNYSSGSHEMMVGVRFKPWKKKATVEPEAASEGAAE
ncbi:MAG: type IX secretion system membrane protein PorP/SprF [Flavobacteriales bacterium]|jgi:type IX secretion system PorP/SprF family membrane protein|nr:type IX secretion system membrane protein PorP/SprF [Flavobacteriales bacterium]